VLDDEPAAPPPEPTASLARWMQPCTITVCALLLVCEPGVVDPVPVCPVPVCAAANPTLKHIVAAAVTQRTLMRPSSTPASLCKSNADRLVQEAGVSRKRSA
jgi:hypothetical protein